MAVKDLFANAKTVGKEAPKKKKGEKEEVQIKDLDYYAAIDTMIKTLNGVKTLYYNSVTNAMMDHFVKETVATKARPANFKGIDTNSEASCELKKRAITSALTESELSVLEQYGISTEKEVSSAAECEKFFFNPSLVADAKLAAKISKALSTIPELKGMDILLREEAKEEESRQVICDKSFEDVAKLTDPQVIKQLYNIIATTSIKAKMTIDDLKTILKLVESTGVKLNN